MSKIKLVLSLALLVAIAALNSGCSTLGSMSISESVIPPAAEGEVNGMYMVDMVPLVGKKASHKGQIRGNMTVQNALDESGALKKMRNVKITVFRIVQGSGRTLKLPVKLQSAKRIVKFEQDYSLHPGDRIVVEARSALGLDQVLNSLMPVE